MGRWFDPNIRSQTIRRRPVDHGFIGLFCARGKETASEDQLIAGKLIVRYAGVRLLDRTVFSVLCLSVIIKSSRVDDERKVSLRQPG